MNLQTATFGAGCFWCTEAIFQTLNGVLSAESGYTGGHTINPTYIEISNGDTGHVEVVKITFDPEVISYKELLLIFFKTHNPTLLNRQGADIGSQYRSAIFYHTNEQKTQAKAMIARLTDEKVFEKPILTVVTKASDFYQAEAKHQNYFQHNMGKPYCISVIFPKMVKFSKEFVEKINPKYLH